MTARAPVLVTSTILESHLMELAAAKCLGCSRHSREKGNPILQSGSYRMPDAGRVLFWASKKEQYNLTDSEVFQLMEPATLQLLLKG